jgi:adenylylsulfate kinase
MVKNNIVAYEKENIETCKKRDYKGAYEKALKGEYQNFSGVNDVYEEPQRAEIVIDTDESVQKIVKFIKKGYIK